MASINSWAPRQVSARLKKGKRLKKAMFIKNKIIVISPITLALPKNKF